LTIYPASRKARAPVPDYIPAFDLRIIGMMAGTKVVGRRLSTLGDVFANLFFIYGEIEKPCGRALSLNGGLVTLKR